MKLSIVATLYQSAPYIQEFHQRATAVAQQFAGDDYEIILVNDGSPDNSLELAVQLTEQDPHLTVVDLSRNFGHHKAMMTGLAQSKGNWVFLIDSDLEEEPEWLLSFSNQMNAEKSDLVFGTQESRKGGYFEKISGWLYYRVFRLLTGIAQPNNIVTARLMTRRYVNALISHQEREINIGGLWMITGFKQVHQPVKKHSTSPTTYSLNKKLSHLVNAVTSFSNIPLIIIFYLGLGLFSLAMIYILYLVINWMFFLKPPSGWTSLIASIWLLGGMIISFIGLLGIYLSKIFSETKQRPYTIVRQIYGSSTE